MVSKMVLVAFMALCCSQALVSAAPKTTSDLKWDQCLNKLPARVVVDAYSVVDVIKRSHHRTSDEATVACFNKYQNDPEAEAECKTAAFEALYSKMNQKAGDIKEVKTTLDKISNDCTDSSSQKAGQLADLYIPDWASCTNALTQSLIQNTRTTLDNVLKTINTVNADRQACDANATNEAALDACKIQAQKAMYLGIRYAEVKKIAFLHCRKNNDADEATLEVCKKATLHEMYLGIYAEISASREKRSKASRNYMTDFY